MPAMKIIAITYIIGFVVTFGAAWNHNPETTDYPMRSAQECNAADALLCASVWPLYWSFRLFQP